MIEITADLLRTIPLPVPKAGSKDQRGRVLVKAGSIDVPGAALLAGTAALRAGAGKLQIATVAAMAPHLAMAIPEALVIGLAGAPDGGTDYEAALPVLLKKLTHCDAVLLGPGMTEGHGTRSLTRMLLEQADLLGFVIDAAATAELRTDAKHVRARNGQVVITPHAGEMATLLGQSRESVEQDPLTAAETAANLLHAVTVMKGAQTHIVDPAGAIWTYKGGGVGLATSGSGDVLAGLIVGLLARGASPAHAAIWGVYLHGEAGARLACSQGPVGFLAREIATEVPAILRELQDVAYRE